MDFQFFDFAVESASADAELFGGSGDIASGFFKGLDDEPMFGVVQIEMIWGERKGWWGRVGGGRGRGGDVQREVHLVVAPEADEHPVRGVERIAVAAARRDRRPQAGGARREGAVIWG